MPRRGSRSKAGGDGWRPWFVPAVLVVVGAAAGVGALALDDHTSADPVGAASPTTPALSARRAPELLVTPLAERRLVGELDGWASQVPEDSCLVVSQGGSPFYEHNPELPLPGASTQKMVTSAAALLALGGDARFETVAASSAPLDDGVLAGDLHIVGGGDPLLATPAYGDASLRGGELLTDVAALVDVIEDAGITHIQGSVIGDESRYDTDRFHPAWPERFRTQNQSGPVSALNVNDGFESFPLEPGNLAAKVPAADPAANAAGIITDLLAARGIAADGPPRSGAAPEDAAPVANLESEPLEQIVAQNLTDSDAETSEMMLKELGLQQERAGSWDAGVTATTDILTESGVSLDGLDIVDGSGLSDQNRLSCQLLIDLLTHPEVGATLVDGLAVAGETGTLEDRWVGTEMAGRVRGKTGTLRNVTALAGQATPLEGEGAYRTFAYVSTVPDPQELTQAQVDLVDPLGEILVDYSAGVDLAQLIPEG